MIALTSSSDAQKKDSATFRYRAYGLNWLSNTPLDLFEPLGDVAAPIDVHVCLRPGELVPEWPVVVGDGKILISNEGLRYREDETATMDVAAPDRVDVFPGTDWNGTLPHSFFSTVTGALLALRGGLTVHGSAVEIDGKAIILCGPSGAGKSTHIAALIANGGRLISDDLTVIEALRPGMPPDVFPGRRCIRLFPGTAAALRHCVKTQSISVSGPKELVVAPQADLGRAFPLAGFILLGADCAGPPIGTPVTVLLKDLWFKPNVFPDLRGHIFRSLAFRAVLAQAKFACVPALVCKNAPDLKVLGKSTLSSWQQGRLSVQFC